jgi:response regulator NasT
LKFALVGENSARVKIITEGLFEAGHRKVVRLQSDELSSRIKAIRPEFLIIDLETPKRKALEEVLGILKEIRLPTAIFVDTSDQEMIRLAVESGVAAYIVDGLKKERIGPIVDMAIFRFNSFSRLLEELEESKIALADRKIIERAKGILMKRNHLSEEEAYVTLRKCAMDENKRIIDIAHRILTAEKITLEKIF